MLLFVSSANAAILTKNNGYFHSRVSYSTSSSLWLRGDEKSDYSGAALLGNSEKATRNYYQVGLKTYWGLGYGFQIGGGLQYGIVHLSNAPILGAAEGDTRSQISEISFETSYQAIKRKNWDLITTLRYLHPGKQGRRHPEFLSFNDFASFLEFELKHNWKSGKISLMSLGKYKKTITTLGNNHFIFEENISYQFYEKVSFGLGLDFLNTDGGFDVADTGFNNFITTQGFLPVWNKKESWLGLSITGDYRINDTWIADAYIHRKILGKNTDISTTIGLGIGRGF